jgi:N-methylhydantoinase A
LLVADYLVDKVKAVLMSSTSADAGVLESAFRDLEKGAEAELRAAGLPAKRFTHQRYAQCRYPGQTWDIDVPVPPGKLTPKSVTQIAELFHVEHEDKHTYARRGEDVLISSLRVRSRGLVDKPAAATLRGGGGPPKPKAHRQAFFDGGFKRTPIYDGDALRAGAKMNGPAIIEERFTTVVVPPRWSITLDKRGNYVATR